MRPFVNGRIILPRLGIRYPVSLCIDTGADRTIIMPGDGYEMRLPYGRLQATSAAVGVGGRVSMYEEQGLVVFMADDRTKHIDEIRFTIAPNERELDALPSLLGRDIISRWRIDFNPPANELRCEVVTADRNITP